VEKLQVSLLPSLRRLSKMEKFIYGDQRNAALVPRGCHRAAAMPPQSCHRAATMPHCAAFAPPQRRSPLSAAAASQRRCRAALPQRHRSGSMLPQCRRRAPQQRLNAGALPPQRRRVATELPRRWSELARNYVAFGVRGRREVRVLIGSAISRLLVAWRILLLLSELGLGLLSLGSEFEFLLALASAIASSACQLDYQPASPVPSIRQLVSQPASSQPAIRTASLPVRSAPASQTIAQPVSSQPTNPPACL